MYERGVELGDYCIAKEQIWLNTFQLENFNERTMINWALDMDQIIDECMAIIKWAMKGMDKRIQNWPSWSVRRLELIIQINFQIWNKFYFLG